MAALRVLGEILLGVLIIFGAFALICGIAVGIATALSFLIFGVAPLEYLR